MVTLSSQMGKLPRHICSEIITAQTHPPPSLSGLCQFQIYHATVKEFLTGLPQEDEVDRAFFFSDIKIKGVFLALPLLKALNFKDNLKRNSANVAYSMWDGPASTSFPSMLHMRRNIGGQHLKGLHEAVILDGVSRGPYVRASDRVAEGKQHTTH
jgi:hypothetical protein